MSGAEKLVFALVSAAVQAGIEASRNRAMEREEMFRMERQNAHLAQMRALRRSELAERMARLETQLAGMQGTLDVASELEITHELASVQGLLMSRDTDCRRAEELIVSLERHIGQLRREQEQQAARMASQRSEMLRQRLQSLQRRITELGGLVDKQHEQAALDEAAQAMDRLAAGAAQMDDIKLDFELRMADKAVDKLEHLVQQDEDSRRTRLNDLLEQLVQYDAIVSGMTADPTVMRWMPGSVAELQEQARSLRSQLDSGKAPDFGKLLPELQRTEKDIVKRASAAQIKADQRDYIVTGIRATLIEMGFVVSEAVAEHHGHPASAMLFSAVNDSGRGINVSVPIEGQIIYDIDGWPKHTESKVGGGKAAVCDEAQQVLEEMHRLLEEGFEVSTGELTWEGKDPDRVLRRADELPGGGSEAEGRRER